MMKLLILLAVAVAGVPAAHGQDSLPAVKGRVTDASTGADIDFADVVIVDTSNRTVARTIVSGGEFRIDEVENGDFLLKIMLLGYRPYTSDTIAFRSGRPIDMGTVSLVPEENRLEGIAVTGSRGRIVYKLDRQRISGSASLSAAGGTAADILGSTPSVRVDADGEVSFRGSTGFLVYVDGKPAVQEGTRALEQIPASTVADIEIITTPSARYKTDGDAGIINIVTKRQTGEGLSGAVGMAGSTLGAWNGDVLLAYRKGPHRWYVGGTGAEIRGKSEFGQQKTTIVDDYTTTSDAAGTRHSNNASYIGRFGWEYGSRRHRLSLEFQGGDTKNARGGDMGYYEHRMQGTNVINDAFYDSHDRYSNEKQLAQLLADYSFRLNERGDRISITGRLRYDWYALEYTESNMFDTTGARSTR